MVISIALAEAARGVERQVVYNALVACRECKVNEHRPRKACVVSLRAGVWIQVHGDDHVSVERVLTGHGHACMVFLKSAWHWGNQHRGCNLHCAGRSCSRAGAKQCLDASDTGYAYPCLDAPYAGMGWDTRRNVIAPSSRPLGSNSCRMTHY